MPSSTEQTEVITGDTNYNMKCVPDPLEQVSTSTTDSRISGGTAANSTNESNETWCSTDSHREVSSGGIMEDVTTETNSRPIIDSDKKLLGEIDECYLASN